ncbi:MAG: tellurium resistance protein TerC [Gammaproteobacteria bacterium]|nr:tellurium resistance protein TerC [Gammaproteobacteria bacterium]NND59822.1 tellurium resistance protein TerC [Gammaproteobacteria bacterium]
MEFLTLDNLFTLAMLTLLQAVLGFDNLLYISLESQRAPADKQQFVRRFGIALAMILRIGLLFLLVNVIELFQDPWFSINLTGVIEGTFTFHAVIVLLGGVFIMYTAVKEIWHMMQIRHLGAENRKPKSVASLIFWIVLMNLVFSFDSILSAIALTDVFWVMATAIFIGAALMIWLSDSVATFLEKNRMYEVLGLFILLIVGIMLLSEGGHLAHLTLFNNPINPMTKATFYFVITVLVLTDIVQSRYRKKLLAQRAAEDAAHA